MDKKIRILTSLAAIFLIAALAAGCTKEVFATRFPLTEGTKWTYSGEYVTRVASRKIRMPVYNHCLSIEGTRDFGGKKYKQTIISAEGSPLSMFFLRDNDGALCCLNGNREDVFFPSQLQQGAAWEISFMGKRKELKGYKAEEVHVPAGTFKTFRIGIYENHKKEGDLWVSADEGIVAIEYREGAQNSSRMVRLELKSFERGTIH